MKKLILACLFISSSVLGFTQVNDTVLTVVQQMPSFPGGSDSLFQYIDNHLQRPEGYVNSMVIIGFIVSKTGKLYNLKIARSVDPALDSAAMQCIRTFPLWQPGIQGGHAVDVAYMVPFRFQKGGTKLNNKSSN